MLLEGAVSRRNDETVVPAAEQEELWLSRVKPCLLLIISSIPATGLTQDDQSPTPKPPWTFLSAVVAAYSLSAIVRDNRHRIQLLSSIWARPLAPSYMRGYSIVILSTWP